MRVIDCDCGTTLQAANDQDLVEVVREHVSEAHPDMEMSGDQAEQLVSAKAYDAEDS